MKSPKISRQKIASSIDKLSGTRKILLLVSLVGLICGLSWYFYLGPARDKIQRMEQEATSLEQDISLFTAQASRLPEMEEELQQLENELILARTLLPEDAHALERLLASFERLGNEQKVSFLLFQPGSEKVQQHFAARNVQLRLQGRFHDLMTYFDSLSRLDRLVSLQSLRLTPVSQGSRQDPVNLTADAVLRVYRALSPAEKEEKEARANE
ncbi:MAG: type 4a pilus biogenesis protein PilO [Desulfonatronovibrionaceae bacterium]